MRGCAVAAGLLPGGLDLLAASANTLRRPAAHDPAGAVAGRAPEGRVDLPPIRISVGGSGRHVGPDRRVAALSRPRWRSMSSSISSKRLPRSSKRDLARLEVVLARRRRRRRRRSGRRRGGGSSPPAWRPGRRCAVGEDRDRRDQSDPLGHGGRGCERDQRLVVRDRRSGRWSPSSRTRRPRRAAPSRAPGGPRRPGSWWAVRFRSPCVLLGRLGSSAVDARAATRWAAGCSPSAARARSPCSTSTTCRACCRSRSRSAGGRGLERDRPTSPSARASRPACGCLRRRPRGRAAAWTATTTTGRAWRGCELLGRVGCWSSAMGREGAGGAHREVRAATGARAAPGPLLRLEVERATWWSAAEG